MMKATNRFLSLLLVALLALGGMMPAAAAEDAFSEDAYQALAADLYGDALPGVGTGVLIGGLKHILSSGGSYVEGKGFDTLWGWIFGTDNTLQQIVESLNRIEGKIDDILRQLGNLKNLLKERSLEDRLTAKLQEMDAANTVLKHAIREFERATTAEAKQKALDIWFEYAPKGYNNAFYFFSNYCDRVAGTTAYEGTSLFTLYDQIADLKWNFDHEGAAFRQMQREADIHFITKMASMLTLWLDRETQDGGGYVSKYTPQQLDGFRRLLHEGLENVIHAYETIPVDVREDRIGFHMYSGDTRIAFDIYKGGAAPGDAPSTVNMHETLVANLRPGKTVSEVEAAMANLLAEHAPPTTMAGEAYTLIDRGAISVLELAAKERKGITVKALLEGAGFPGGDWRFALYTRTDKANMPLRFGEKITINPIIGITRTLHIYNVDLAEKNIAAQSFLGNACVGGPRHPQLDQLAKPIVRLLFYESVHANYEMASRIKSTGYMPIWIANAQNVPVVDTLEAAGAEGPMEAVLRVDGVSEGVLTGAATEYEGAQVRLYIDEGTALPEGVTQAMLPGKTVKAAYEAADMAGWQEGMPLARATRITLDGPEGGKTLDGAVVRLETAAQIIGGAGDLVVEANGQEHMFVLTAKTAMDDGVIPGVTVSVAYHEGEAGVRLADTVTVTGLGPVPMPQIVEGSITALRREDMPGSQGTLSIGIPGGEMTLGVPTGIVVDALREGLLVRVTYHTLGGDHTVDGIEVIGNPIPVDESGVVDGVVTRYDVSMEIIGQPAQVDVAIPGGAMTFAAPYGLPAELDVGAPVHVHYHLMDGVYYAYDISVAAPPPGPVDPVDPVDPIDPVPAPVQAWVEGYVTQRQDDATQLAPGQARALVVSAAGQDYTLHLPDGMTLDGDVQVGAFVHVDYMALADGQSIISHVLVMQPAPQPADDPMPGPLDDPMPGGQ